MLMFYEKNLNQCKPTGHYYSYEKDMKFFLWLM